MSGPVLEYTARLREQMAFARGRCAVLHELDLDDREIPCLQCRVRAAEAYPAAARPAETPEGR